MRIGIFGSPQDLQVAALAAMLQQRGVSPCVVDSLAIHRGASFSFDGRGFSSGADSLDDVACWFVRHVSSPLPPTFQVDDSYLLFDDWFVDYMQRRERFGFQLAWLCTLGLQGVPVVNPPEHGSVLQLKPFQLAAARAVGLAVPRTLVTNDPERVRGFAAEVGEVVYKPSSGGSLCRPLDAAAMARLPSLTAAPVIFQERVRGLDVRVTAIGERIVSAVGIPTEQLDFRADPEYTAGRQEYLPVELPAPVAERVIRLMHTCGLVFSGVDLILRDDGEYVFVEANSSPIYLDIERKTQVPITGALADYLLRLALDPARLRAALAGAARPRSFLRYANPYAPEQELGPAP